MATLSKDTTTYWRFRWLKDCGYIGLSGYTRDFMQQLADMRHRQLEYGGEISECAYLREFNS